jgi:hypothetical protein
MTSICSGQIREKRCHQNRRTGWPATYDQASTKPDNMKKKLTPAYPYAAAAVRGAELVNPLPT